MTRSGWDFAGKMGQMRRYHHSECDVQLSEIMFRNPLFNCSRSTLDHASAWVLCLFISWISLTACQSATGFSSSPSPMAEQISISAESLCGVSPDKISTMNESDVRRWLAKNDSPVMSRQEDPNSTVVYTLDSGKGGTTAFLRGGHLFRVINSVEIGPSFGRVVSSLGNPETISLESTRPRHPDAILYHLGLDYPKFGFSVSSGRLASSRELEHAGELQVQVSTESIIDLIECYEPSASIETALNRMSPSAPMTVDYQMSLRRTWPGFGAWVPLPP